MLSLPFLVAAFAAAQDPVAPIEAPAEPAPPAVAAPLREQSTTALGRRFDAKKRAEEACSFNATTGLNCSKEWMQWFNIVETVAVDAPEGLVATGRLVPLKGRECDVGLQVSMTHKTKGITVDWASSTMDVDRRAVPLLPGFARRATAALAQRTSTAAPDTLLEELVLADAEDGTCLVKLEKGTPSTALRVRLAVSLDGATDTLTITDSLTWESIDEVRLLEVLGAQPVIPEPERPLTATLIGAGAGTALTLPISAILGVNIGRSNGVAAGILAGIGIAAAYGVICVGPCAAAGFYLSDARAWEQADVEAERKGRADAIRRRRVELGIEAAPPPSLDPAS